MTTISSHFIGDYKTGDNICYNLKSLNLLYRTFDSVNPAEKLLLIKPIALLIGGVAEAVLFDFEYRARNHTTEGIEGLKEKALKMFKQNKRDEFSKLIVKAKEQNLFADKADKFYEELDGLRMMRNRLHIQNKNNELERDEDDVFTTARKIKIERTLEHLMKTMVEKYPRPKTMNYVQDFVLPWESHFDNDSFL